MTDDTKSYRLPPQDWRDADQWVFLGFILHFHESQCKCGAKSSWSKPMKVFGHRAYLASKAHRMIPFESGWMPSNEPLALYSLPIEHTVICHKCINTYAAAPDDVVELRVVNDERNWYAALMEDKRREQRAATKPAAVTPHVPTADLMNL